MKNAYHRSNFSANNSQHFFFLWSPKRSATILDPFLPTLYRGHARSLRMDYKDLRVVFFPRCTAGPKLVGSCCTCLHTTANTHATTANIVCATILGVVASVCTQPKAQVYKETLKHVRQLSTLLIVIRFLSSLSLILSVNMVDFCHVGSINIIDNKYYAMVSSDCRKPEKCNKISKSAQFPCRIAWISSHIYLETS